MIDQYNKFILKSILNHKENWLGFIFPHFDSNPQVLTTST